MRITKTTTGLRARARCLLPILVAGFTLGSASALSFSDLDYFDDVSLDANSTTATPADYQGQFDLKVGGDPWDQDGFDPGTMVATSGYVAFVLGTSEADTQEFTISLNGLSSGTQFFDAFKFYSSGLSADLLVAISESGTLSYTISAISGSFNLYGSYLEIEAETSTSVPDGGSTAVLLGLGVLGLASVRRIRKS